MLFRQSICVNYGKQESLPGKEYPFYMSVFSNEMDAPCMFHVADALF